MAVAIAEYTSDNPRIGNQMDFGADEALTRAEPEFTSATFLRQHRGTIVHPSMLMKLETSRRSRKSARKKIHSEFYTR